MRLSYLSLAVLALSISSAIAQKTVPVFADPVITIDFQNHVRDWDGFGVNYVETAQTRDYKSWAQDYGGFSILSEEKRQEIIELIFGDDGLKPSITKLFLDPFHEGLSKQQNDNADPYVLNESAFDHRSTTKWMLYFNREGLKKTRARNGTLQMITTLYGPAPWMTRQKFVLGPNLDPAEKYEVAEYMVGWVKYLVDHEKLPVTYLSLHNEGDAYYRWPRDGSGPGEDHRDYNMHWTPELVTAFLKTTREMLNRHGLKSVGLTPGETQTWYRFHMWGYANKIRQDKHALRSLGLITSHSFVSYDDLTSVYYGDYRSNGIDILQSSRPDLHAWVTSMSWGKTVDARFADAVFRNIYITKCNAAIPWALIQRSSQWVGGDPNPGTAIRVNEDSTYTVEPGYYYYKQLCRAGQAGMAVAHVTSLDPSVSVIAFSKAGTKNPDAFILINLSDKEKETQISLEGGSWKLANVYRTSAGEQYAFIGRKEISANRMVYNATPGSVTTFYLE